MESLVKVGCKTARATDSMQGDAWLKWAVKQPEQQAVANMQAGLK